MISRVLPFSSTVRPMIRGSPPNWLRQRASPIMATSGPLGRSSASVKLRPSLGGTWSRGIKLAETQAAATRRGAAAPPASARFSAPASYTPMASMVWAYLE